MRMQRLARATYFKFLETVEKRSGERRSARGEREAIGGADMLEEPAGADQFDGIKRQDLRRCGSGLAKRLQPVTERAMFRRRSLGLGGDARFVIGALMRRRQEVLVDVVRRMPSAQCSHQDEDDRERGYRLRAESQRTYQRNTKPCKRAGR